jgi:1,6-anhydro-N-acetylmuramate kinase
MWLSGVKGDTRSARAVAWLAIRWRPAAGIAYNIPAATGSAKHAAS